MTSRAATRVRNGSLREARKRQLVAERYESESSTYRYPVRDTWHTAIDPHATLAARLRTAIRELDRVEYEEAHRLSGESLSRLSTALKIVRDVEADLS
jgi:hypothetical protein